MLKLELNFQEAKHHTQVWIMAFILSVTSPLSFWQFYNLYYDIAKSNIKRTGISCKITKTKKKTSFAQDILSVWINNLLGEIKELYENDRISEIHVNSR